METACNLVLFERWEVDTSQFFVIGNDCSITEEAWIRKKDFKSPAALSPRFRTEVLTTYLREQTRTGSRYGDYRSTDEVKWEAEIGLSLLNPVTPSRAFHLYSGVPIWAPWLLQTMNLGLRLIFGQSLLSAWAHLNSKCSNEESGWPVFLKVSL